MQTLINHVPPHDVLVIPFAGHCALSRTIQPCSALLLCDLDDEVRSWWQSRLPAHARFQRSDGIGLLEEMAIDAESSGGVLECQASRVCVYCDPPYRLVTRTSDTRYRHDWTDRDHQRFLQALTRLAATQASLMVSHYRNDMYDTALRSWRRTDFTAQTRGGPRTESLYCNFEVTDLHDFRFYGGESSTQASPRRQREVLKRREQSARRKIAAMAPLERKRFLRSLVAEFGDDGIRPAPAGSQDPASVDRPMRKAGRNIDRPSYR